MRCYNTYTQSVARCLKILFLAANPVGTGKIAFDREVRAITSKLRAAKYRDSIVLVSEWAVRVDDLLPALLEHQPQVIHFSGHGTRDGILLADADDRPKAVSPRALNHLFAALADEVKMVLFNACFSAAQARALIEHIDCAVGMSHEVCDEVAISFAAAFYHAIGFGQSVQKALDMGKATIEIKHADKISTPVMVVKDGIDPSEMKLVRNSDVGARDVPSTAWHPLDTTRDHGGFGDRADPLRCSLPHMLAGVVADPVLILHRAGLQVDHCHGSSALEKWTDVCRWLAARGLPGIVDSLRIIDAVQETAFSDTLSHWTLEYIRYICRDSGRSSESLFEKADLIMTLYRLVDHEFRRWSIVRQHVEQLCAQNTLSPTSANYIRGFESSWSGFQVFLHALVEGITRNWSR